MTIHRELQIFIASYAIPTLNQHKQKKKQQQILISITSNKTAKSSSEVMHRPKKTIRSTHLDLEQKSLNRSSHELQTTNQINNRIQIS